MSDNHATGAAPARWGPAGQRHAPASRVPAPGTREAGTALALAGLGAAFVVATMPWWREGLTIPWDARNHFYPMLRWLANELHAGRVPQFMAEVFAGRPSLPDPQSMVTSPGFLLLAAVHPDPPPVMMDMLVLTELFLGGAALLLLGRMFGLHPVAGLLGAIVFVFGGAPMARLQHVLLVQSYAFVPVVLLAVAALIRRPTVLRGVAAGATVGLLIVGRDHVALLSLYAVAAFALVLLARQPAPLRHLRGALPSFLAAGMVAAAVAVPPILATLLMAADSNRPAFPVSISGAGGMCPACLLTLGFPNLFDGLWSLHDYWGPGTRGFAWPNSSDSATVQYYAGAGTVVIALFGLISLRKAPVLQWFGCGVLAAALLYGMGNWTPAFQYLHAAIPGVDRFRRASDGAFLFQLGLAVTVLAAAGRLVRDPDAKIRLWQALVIAAVVLLSAALALWVAWRHAAVAQAAGDIAVGVGLALAALAVLTFGAIGSVKRRVGALGLVAALTFADLALQSAGTGLNARAPDLWRVQPNPLAEPVVQRLVAAVDAAEAQMGPVRTEIRGFGGAGQNLSLIVGVDNISGYNPIFPADYALATGVTQNSHQPKRRFGEQMTGYASPLTDLLGVRFILLSAPMGEIDSASDAAFPEPIRIGDAYLYENPSALPRAMLVCAAATQPLRVRLAQGAGPLPPLDWRSEALVMHSAATGPQAVGHDRAPCEAGSLTITAHAPGHLEATIAPTSPGYAVLHELRAAGWTAHVDGEARPLVPANGLFQAVPVGPSDTRVVFRYSQWHAFRTLLSRTLPW